MAEGFFLKVKEEEPWTSEFVEGWKRFFDYNPTYKNIFTRVESRENFVIMIGYALWSKDSNEKDHCIWTATIENDLLLNWQIYDNTEENRKKLEIR
jgi:hypothetical protein